MVEIVGHVYNWAQLMRSHVVLEEMEVRGLRCGEVQTRRFAHNAIARSYSLLLYAPSGICH